MRTYLMMIVGMRMWMGMRKIQIVGGTGKKVWGGEHGKIGGGEFRSFRLLVVVVVAALPCPAGDGDGDGDGDDDATGSVNNGKSREDNNGKLLFSLDDVE